MKHLLILDGHKSHINLDVLQKAKRKDVDMVTLPSYISHGLLLLDVSCFGPFKQYFKA